MSDSKCFNVEEGENHMGFSYAQAWELGGQPSLLLSLQTM
jgi:hypothetical protein